MCSASYEFVRIFLCKKLLSAYSQIYFCNHPKFVSSVSIKLSKQQHPTKNIFNWLRVEAFKRKSCTLRNHKQNLNIFNHEKYVVNFFSNLMVIYFQSYGHCAPSITCSEIEKKFKEYLWDTDVTFYFFSGKLFKKLFNNIQIDYFYL